MELELIIERLQNAPPEIKNEEFRKFINVLHDNDAQILRCMGYDWLAERVENLRELAKKDKEESITT
ncbi:hypothetical protein [Pyrococcus kukulkanii]|uniref:hypothetical protein n=1 Tax=Pyrococcus kukulkanii TaxID=1609559 RepID=UPI003562C849